MGKISTSHQRMKKNDEEDVMKKLLALSLVAALMPSLAMARGNHPMAGCGLGYMLLSNKDNEKVTQVLGATTNGTFGTQTFGISSGTSGCTEDGAVKMAKAKEGIIAATKLSARSFFITSSSSFFVCSERLPVIFIIVFLIEEIHLYNRFSL